MYMLGGASIAREGMYMCNVYVTVTEKREHSAQNVHSSYKRL